MMTQWRLILFAMFLITSMPSVAQSLEWDRTQWGGDWQEGGNSDFLDTDGDNVLNRTDTDDDGDGIPDEVEIAAELDPLDASDALLDTDKDGLTNLEEYQLGTDINNPDTDGDGIVDGADTSPLTAEVTGIPAGKVILLDDINEDEINDIGLLVNDTEEGMSLVVFDGNNLLQLKTVSINGSYSDPNIVTHPDLSGDGISEIGVYGSRSDSGNEGKGQYQVLNVVTGTRMKSYNWPANWENPQFMVLSDVTGDDIPEVGLQGVNRNNSRPQLLVRDGDSQGGLYTISFPDLLDNPDYVQLSDMNADGFEDIGLYGTLKRNGKPQVRVSDAFDPRQKLNGFGFGNKWDNPSWHRLSDSTGDGIDEWGLFGIRKDDGRPQLLNKRGHDPRGMLRIFSWPGDMQDAEFRRIPDMTFDQVDEIAAFGLRGNNRWQLSIKDGADRGVVIANYGWPNNWQDVSIEILSDLNDDGIVEVALLGINGNGDWELIVRDGQSKRELGRGRLGNDWTGRPGLLNMENGGSDAVSNVMVFGEDGEGAFRLEPLNL